MDRVDSVYLWGGERFTESFIPCSVRGCRTSNRSDQFLDFLRQCLVERHTPHYEVRFVIEALNGEEIVAVDPAALPVVTD